jgi:hypothetical protein
LHPEPELSFRLRDLMDELRRRDRELH